MAEVIRVEDVSKKYRLGVINRGMLAKDLQSWWARFRGKEDPNASLVGYDQSRIENESDFWALRSIDFKVEAGETLGIIGRNGAGKSTLLKILSRTTSPTTGKILTRGRISSLLEVGTGFHPELTGRENVYLNGSILGMSRSEVKAKFDEIVEFSGLSDFIDTPVKRYSSGMYVRLAFSVAAHLEPEILIVDEVLAVGDADFQRKCLGRMGKVTQEGRTVVFVSHNMSAVQSLCRRGIVIQDGKMQFDGTARDAVDYYLHQNAPSPTSFLLPENHIGTGGVVVDDIYFTDDRGRRVTSPASGQSIDVHFHYRHADARRYPSMQVSVSFSTPDQVRIFNHRNALKGTIFRDLPATGEVILNIPKFPLPAGEYELHYSIKSERAGGDRLDGSVVGMSFQVDAGDFFGTGVTTSAESGLCFVDGDWRNE